MAIHFSPLDKKSGKADSVRGGTDGKTGKHYLAGVLKEVWKRGYLPGAFVHYPHPLAAKVYLSKMRA